MVGSNLIKVSIGIGAIAAISSGVYLANNSNPLIGEKNPIVSNKTGITSNSNPLIGEKNPIISNKVGITSNINPLIGEKNPIVSNKVGITSNSNPLIGEKNPIIGNKVGITNNSNPLIGEKNPIISNKTGITKGSNNSLDKFSYATSSIDNSLMVVSNTSDKSLFHYKFENNIITLYGDFKRSGNEVYKLQNDNGFDAFLYFNDSYYGLKNNTTNSPLIKIEDNTLINNLNGIRK